MGGNWFWGFGLTGIWLKGFCGSLNGLGLGPPFPYSDFSWGFSLKVSPKLSLFFEIISDMFCWTFFFGRGFEGDGPPLLPQEFCSFDKLLLRTDSDWLRWKDPGTPRLLLELGRLDEKGNGERCEKAFTPYWGFWMTIAESYLGFALPKVLIILIDKDMVIKVI